MGLPWYKNAVYWPLAVNLGKFRPATTPLLAHDQRIVERIREDTRAHNIDNIERTRAYLSFYQKHKQIHWSLLAHLVSRNAGWSMTDLRGELLPRLLRPKEQQDYFSFLERGNWLIFHDAYPQLLLYEESVRRQTNLFLFAAASAGLYIHASGLESFLENKRQAAARDRLDHQ